MTNFRRMAKRLRIDLGDFNSFMDAALNQRKPSPYRMLFEAYDKSLADIELQELRQAAWIRANLDKPDFEVGYKERGERLKVLERESLARLELIFRAYRKARASGE